MSLSRHIPTSLRTAALLLALSLAAACDSPTRPNGGGAGGPIDPVPADPPAVASVQVAPDTLTLLAVGGHRRLSATLRAANQQEITGRTIEWASSDLAVATVTADGHVVGHNPGRATIIARSEGKVGQAQVQVLPLTVDSLAVSQRWMEVQWATSRPLSATPYSADGRVLWDRPVFWSTSDSSVATVSTGGQVTAQGGGRAWITATSEGRTARVEIVVPMVKEMSLSSAGGRTLPAVLVDSVQREGYALRRVRVVAVQGTLSLHSRTGEYQQRVVVRRYERLGTATEWGSQIWEMEERLVGEEVVYDRGRMEYNVFTGEPIFVSTVREGWTYYAQSAPQDALTVWQALPGTGPVRDWEYRL